jgi:hypothetical protein
MQHYPFAKYHTVRGASIDSVSTINGILEAVKYGICKTFLFPYPCINACHYLLDIKSKYRGILFLFLSRVRKTTTYCFIRLVFHLKTRITGICLFKIFGMHSQIIIFHYWQFYYTEPKEPSHLYMSCFVIYFISFLKNCGK